MKIDKIYLFYHYAFSTLFWGKAKAYKSLIRSKFPCTFYAIHAFVSASFCADVQLVLKQEVTSQH